jgi:hypothetical protein
MFILGCFYLRTTLLAVLREMITVMMSRIISPWFAKLLSQVEVSMKHWYHILFLSWFPVEVAGSVFTVLVFVPPAAGRVTICEYHLKCAAYFFLMKYIINYY